MWVSQKCQDPIHSPKPMEEKPKKVETETHSEGSWLNR